MLWLDLTASYWLSGEIRHALAGLDGFSLILVGWRNEACLG